MNVMKDNSAAVASCDAPEAPVKAKHSRKVARLPLLMALCMAVMCVSAFAADGETEAATVTISSLMSAVGQVFTQVISWVGTVATTVTGSPLLLLACVGVPLCGIGVGMFGRLIHSRV